MERIAIIGSGIAGLGCAHFLHRRAAITVYEANAYLGGHSNTIDVKEAAGRVAVFDTGFMVYNEVTYPHLTRLFRVLEVPTKPTSMSFSVRHDPTGVEWNGTSLNTLFAQRRNLLRLRHWRFLLQLNRFNREAVEALEDPQWAEMTLETYVAARDYGSDFLEHYLIPMSSAVWSTPRERMLRFPAMTLLRFWHNHGFLGLHTQHPWRTVDGGSREYVRRLTAPFLDRVRLETPVLGVADQGDFVEVRTSTGSERYDRVILASHADQALALLETPTAKQRTLLEPFRYQHNAVTVHSETAVMPQTRDCWASWNYRAEDAHTSVHYWMNSLQGVSRHTHFFVSLNAENLVPEASRKRQLDYEHPLFDLAAIQAQKRLPELNTDDTRVYFCGSYFRYGFHEDALRSAVDLCESLLGHDPWEGTS